MNSGGVIRALEVLPPDLLARLYEHVPRGGMLYIPRRTGAARIKRDLEIFQMRSEGKTITEISERMLLHRATVYRILSHFVK
jgi:Mor family transcriptional regulator